MEMMYDYLLNINPEKYVIHISLKLTTTTTLKTVYKALQRDYEKTKEVFFSFVHSRKSHYLLCFIIL